MPYFLPKLPVYFIRKFKPNFGRAGSNDSVDCTFQQLHTMAQEIAKFSALGSGPGLGAAAGLL